MKRTFAILVVVFGFISSGLFFSAGIILNETGKELTGLKSRGGESVAEHYYQGIGHYGVAYSLMAYAFGVGSLMLSIGLGGLLLSSKND